MTILLNWPGKAAALGQAESIAAHPPNRTAVIKTNSNNYLIQGDNLYVLANLLATHRHQFDLIAIDPPFAVGMDFQARIKTANGRQKIKAYRDKWELGIEGYLDMIAPRLSLCIQLLKPNGSIVIHCDWRVSHHIRSLLDEMMPGGFRNQIAWIYSQTGRGAKAHARQFPRNHDQLIWASKGPHPTFHGDVFRRVYSEKEAKSRGFRKDEDGRWFKTAPRGDYTDESIARLAKEGRIYRTRGGKIRIKYFLPTEKGSVIEELPVGDAWLDIPDAMHLSKKEQTGYATQKPLKLQERLISALTSPGDLVGDFFCGSGATLLAASRLQRHYVGCDQGDLAIHTTLKRLHNAPPNFDRIGSAIWLDVPISVVRNTNGITLSLPNVWPSHPELSLSAPDFIDMWSVGMMYDEVFTPLWTTIRDDKGLRLTCPHQFEAATHIMVCDLVGRRSLAALND